MTEKSYVTLKHVAAELGAPGQTRVTVVEAAPVQRPGSVTLQPPRTDAASRRRAARAEAAVRAELAEFEPAMTFDDALLQRRGRR